MAACKSRFVAAIRKLSDFIEEDRASFCQFKAAQTSLSCSCKGAFLMAKQF
jgi:hypothetical protein